MVPRKVSRNSHGPRTGEVRALRTKRLHWAKVPEKQTSREEAGLTQTSQRITQQKLLNTDVPKVAISRFIGSLYVTGKNQKNKNRKALKKFHHSPLTKK